MILPHSCQEISPQSRKGRREIIFIRIPERGILINFSLAKKINFFILLEGYY
jgi:hypothetical protein